MEWNDYKPLEENLIKCNIDSWDQTKYIIINYIILFPILCFWLLVYVYTYTLCNLCNNWVTWLNNIIIIFFISPLNAMPFEDFL